MPSNVVAVTDAAWVQAMGASTTAFAIVTPRESDTTPGMPMSPVKWKAAAAQPPVADTGFSYAQPGDQINGQANDPVWVIAVHPQGSEVVAYDE